MGHVRLGKIPKSRKWQQLVDLMTSAEAGPVRLSDDVDRISAHALEAAKAGLDKAIDDKGLRYSFYLLTQLVLSARRGDWEQELVAFGIKLADDASVFDLTAEIQYAIDDYLADWGHPTDISEMAQQAVGEAISGLAGPQSVTLFDTNRESLRLAVKRMSTKKGFSQLGQTFFGRFLAHYLDFYLCRITAAQMGGQRIPNVAEATRFNEALSLHCRQSARIVHDYCGEWYSKTEWEQGIDLDNTSGFVAVAINKLQKELARQGAGE